MRGCPAEDFFALGAPPLTVPHQASVFLSVKEYTGDGPHAPPPLSAEICERWDLVDELVLVEIQYIRVVRPVIPIFERKLVAEAH